MAPYVTATAKLPSTDRLAGSNIALPMSPVLGSEQAEQVVAAIAASRA
jgi:dTDP-4-amino-4,6-dideoxygalactose transaminase